MESAVKSEAPANYNSSNVFTIEEAAVIEQAKSIIDRRLFAHTEEQALTDATMTASYFKLASEPRERPSFFNVSVSHELNRLALAQISMFTQPLP